MNYPTDFINKIIYGDCLEIMKKIPENVIDSVICDPPYEIGFMSKSWDNQGIAFKKETWQEILRVAKPGATLLCFGGTRTYHRLACAIEDAGWILKDCIMWLYGSGFPKAGDISKQIDKRAGKERKVVGKNPHHRTLKETNCMVGEPHTGNGMLTEPTTPEAKLWNGWKSHGLKPAYEPILVAMKPNEGSYAENALRYGVSGLNIDGGRIEGKMGKDRALGKPRINTDKYGKANPHLNPQSPKGRFPANIILECICDKVIEGKEEKVSIHDAPKGTFAGGKQDRGSIKNYRERSVGKTVIHTNPDCPCYMLDEQSGERKGWTGQHHNEFNPYGGNALQKSKTIRQGYHQGFNDKGGASRFFYTAKASKSERNVGLENFYWLNGKLIEKELYEKLEKENETLVEERKHRITKGNIHPTVKSLSLCEYLCTLTKTPTGGIVLDPFIGSGTTAMACKRTGRPFIGIEKEEEYCKIAEARIKATQLPLPPPQSLGI